MTHVERNHLETYLQNINNLIALKKALEDEISKALNSKATKEEIGEITKKVIKRLYKDLSFHHPYIIDRIKV